MRDHVERRNDVIALANLGEALGWDGVDRLN